MSLYVHEKCTALAGCGPEARFLLEAVSRQVQIGACNRRQALRPKILSKQFRLAEQPVKRALRELEAAGALVFDEGVPGRRGRPPILFRISPATLAEIQGRQQVCHVHAPIVARLFSPEDIMTAALELEEGGAKEDASPRDTTLSACNRFLLATLLMHADQFGVVTISKGKLKQLTGFSDARLRYRLDGLVGSRLIVAHIPGISSSIFPKSKASSTYFLDLAVLGAGIPGEEFLPEQKLGHPGAQCPSRDQILGLDLGKKEARPVRLKAFLSGQRDAVFDVLRFRFLRYASYVLSRYGVNPTITPTIEDAQLRETISADFQVPERWRNGQEVHDLEWEEIISHFYRLAFTVARTFAQRSDLPLWVDGTFEEMCIVPSDGRVQLFFMLYRVDALGASQAADSAP
ncbi:hypothetical protein [Pseudomonas sp. Q1-7]|uniref:hypothetical protein n=1 Tax=Pseudomonas sp. Q1-7 TaxID=3020843 RepID=UPI002301A3B9|nr:hypothetical protein [Pseudomonas sp. Q1-7]